jgi:hypothetical protein
VTPLSPAGEPKLMATRERAWRPNWSCVHEAWRSTNSSLIQVSLPITSLRSGLQRPRNSADLNHLVQRCNEEARLVASQVS